MTRESFLKLMANTAKEYGAVLVEKRGRHNRSSVWLYEVMCATVKEQQRIALMIYSDMVDIVTDEGLIMNVDFHAVPEKVLGIIKDIKRQEETL